MSHMAREAAEAPEAVARFLDRNSRTIGEIGARLRAKQPPVIITSARGSSDNAAGYFKYLTEILTGIPCSDSLRRLLMSDSRLRVARTTGTLNFW